ncbi:MAG: AtpZ/AtpI family protein [Bacteroidales bacterium]|nr:AtpZ/AtpI family protein [Bacteroidales bacterium]
MNKGLHSWVRYSTLGIEMAVIVGAAVCGGVALDRHRGGDKFPLFTLLLTVIGLTVAMVRLVRSVNRMDNKEGRDEKK